MNDHGAIRWLVLGLVTVAFICVLLLPYTGLVSKGNDWGVTEDGLLEYSLSPSPEYSLTPSENTSSHALYLVKFTSRGDVVEGLLRMPQTKKDKEERNKSTSGIVLLPGATVTKEREQGLAKYFCSLGYATITLDQRNLGVTNPPADLQMFLRDLEPTEHKMVYDALAFADILRSLPGIDPNLIIYVGESNGGRVAIIACALDAKARGVIAISTCGYGADEAVASGEISDPDTIRFYRSIDPDTYLGKIPPRKLVMIHSLNDTVIPYDYAVQTYAKAFQPKILHTVGCTKHGYCTDMNAFLEKELTNMSFINNK